TPVEPVMKVVCGRNEEAVKKAAGALGWEESETDWRRIMERDDIDLIDICSPGDAHKPQAIAAAEAKKVVFCEKPLANTLKEAEKVVRRKKKHPLHSHHLPHPPPPPRRDAGQTDDRGWRDRRDLSLSRHIPAGLDRRSDVPPRLAIAEI